MSSAREIYESDLWLLSVAERRAALAKAVALADAEGDLDLAFEIRTNLISASHASPDRLAQVAAYGWCLARHDEDPKRFPIDLWYYKWIPGAVAGSPDVSRAQLNELLDDLAARFDAGARESAPVLKLRMVAAFDLGDTDDAGVLFDAWMACRAETGRSPLNDCRACDIAEEANALRKLGRHQEAIEAGLPLIDGTQGCSSEPHYALANALESARALHLWDRAAGWHRRGLDLIENDPDYLDALASHLRYLAVSGSVAEAGPIVDNVGVAVRLATTALATLDGDEEFEFRFFRGVRLVLAAADGAGLKSDEITALHDSVDGKAEALAEAFDARNGNTSFVDALAGDDAELFGAKQ